MTRLQAWKTAARTHTLPAAIVPVLVGAGLANGDGVFRVDAIAWALVGALALQIAANFANDASDAKRGADTKDRLGPPRMVASGEITSVQMWTATWISVGVAGVAGVALTLIAGPLILVIGVASVIAMLGYVGGPFPYGYRGLGEVFVFVFFGPVATVGSRYVHDMTAPLSAWLLAIPVGMLVTAILVVNNYRDIETDETAGKRTLAVILGRDRTRTLFAALVYGSYPLIVLFALVGWTPRTTMFAALLAPFAAGPVRIINAKTDGMALIRALKLTAMLHLWTGVVLAAGAAIGL
ncbi:MAG: 1,4-dihydroxy-2-naphthoate polyprenyltransferase [Acidimicrobiia bacterium]